MENERASFTGRIADVGVAELLRTVTESRQSGVARFEVEAGRATLWFRAGEIVDAEMGRFHTEDAVRELLKVDEGTFEVEFKPIDRPAIIKEDAATLLRGPEAQSRSGGRGRRRAPRGWTPTAGGTGATTGSSAAAVPPPAAGAPPAAATPGPRERMTTARRRTPRPPSSPPSARRTKSTVFGMPLPGAAESRSPAGDGSTPQEPDPAKPAAKFPGAGLIRTVDTFDPRDKTVLRFVPPATPGVESGEPSRYGQAQPTAWGHSQPIALPRAEDRAATGPRVPVEDEPSGPIAVGTSWQAPSHLTTTAPPPPTAIRSDASATAGGEIKRGRGTGETRIPTFSPPFVKPSESTESFVEPQAPRPDPGEARGRIVGGRADPKTIALPVLGEGPPRAPDDGRRDSDAPPAVVGRYEVLLRIARGGMGTVYLCRVTGEGGFRRLFALKVIRDHLSRNAEYVQMLLQEARIASRLHHPNVVGIVDIGILSGQHYLVMEYVEGCTFSELLKVHTRNRPPQLIVPIILDALTGLQAAHTLVDDDGTPLTLVHCDFSPQNMLVGTNGICQISDFGIAKAADALHDQSGVMRGKPGYLSPEQVRGDRIDHRADIFSAGVVLWNALTGEQLFTADTPDRTLDQVLAKPIPAPSTVGLRPPSCFDAVCLRALERDPERRYQSAEEMLIELRRIAITEDLLAPSSDIARWVTDTFGHQLELRRQAAGIAPRQRSSLSGAKTKAIAVPELGLGSDETATHAVAPTSRHTPRPSESGSRTLMLPSDVNRPGGARRTGPPRVIVEDRSKVNLALVGVAAALGAALVVSAFLRPDWFQGGRVDEYGVYVDMPAAIDLDLEVDAEATQEAATLAKKQAEAIQKAAAEVAAKRAEEEARKQGEAQAAAGTSGGEETEEPAAAETEGEPAEEEPAEAEPEPEPAPKPRKRRAQPAAPREQRPSKTSAEHPATTSAPAPESPAPVEPAPAPVVPLPPEPTAPPGPDLEPQEGPELPLKPPPGDLLPPSE